MTHAHDHESVTPEGDDKKQFDEIARRTVGNYMLKDGQLEYKFAEEGASNQVDLPDTPFSAPEVVARDGKSYVRRDLDLEGLTPKEETLAEQVALRDERIVARVDEILAGEPVTNLPKAIQTESGVTQVEKDITRETVDSLVRAEEGKTAKNL